MSDLLNLKGQAVKFLEEEQAEKAKLVLRYIYNLKMEVEPGIRKNRKYYFLRYEAKLKDKVMELEKEIGAVCLIVQCFELGDPFPTQTYLRGSMFSSGLSGMTSDE